MEKEFVYLNTRPPSCGNSNNACWYNRKINISANAKLYQWSQ